MKQAIKTRLVAMATLLAVGLISQPALAYDWDVQTTVAVLEATYMPNQIPFTINGTAGACAQGTLYWIPQGADETKQIANAEAIFSLLLTAKMSNKTIEIYGYNSGCNVAFIHIIN